MPDESCRICGGELIIHTVCSDCRKSNQKRCRSCNCITLIQAHQICKNTISTQKYSLVQIIQKDYGSLSNKNSLHVLLLVIGMVGFSLMGLVTISYIGVLPGIQDESQFISSNNIAMKINDSFPVKYGKLYGNCLAYGSGQSITVTCPTENGSIYKGILKMPQDLKKEFSDSVFSIRGMTLTENLDGSIILQYQHVTYLTSYFGI